MLVKSLALCQTQTWGQSPLLRRSHLRLQSQVLTHTTVNFVQARINFFAVHIHKSNTVTEISSDMTLILMTSSIIFLFIARHLSLLSCSTSELLPYCIQAIIGTLIISLRLQPVAMVTTWHVLW